MLVFNKLHFRRGIFSLITFLMLFNSFCNISYSYIMQSSTTIMVSDVIDSAGITNILDLNVPKGSNKKITFSLGQTIAGLSSGSTYKGQWGFLNTYTVAESSDTTPPSAISNLTALGNPPDISAEGSIKLTWTAPGDDGIVGLAVNYLLRYSSITNISNDTDFSALGLTFIGQYPPSPETSGNVQSMTVLNLEPGVTYYFALKAADERDNTGVWNRATGVNEKNFATAFDTAPPTVSNFNIIPSSGEVKIFWSTVTTASNDIAYYELWYDSSNPTMSVANLLTTTASTWFTHKDLVNNNTYYYSIIVVDKPPVVYKSTMSKIVSGCPVATGEPAIPSHLSGVAIDTSTIQWSWGEVSGITRYRLYSSAGLIIRELPVGTTIWQESGLGINTASEIRYVVAYNEVFESKRCELSNFPIYTLSMPPSMLSIIETSASKVILQWDKNNNSSSVRYGIQYSQDNFVTDVSTFANYQNNITITSATVTGLTPGTTYYFRTLSFNNNGIASNPSNIVTTVTPSGSAPANITDLRSGLILSTSVYLLWSAPGEDGNTGDLNNGKYYIKYSDYDKDGITSMNDWNAALYELVLPTNTIPGSLECIVITGLASGTTFSFSIRTEDSNGIWSGLSNSVILVTFNTSPPAEISNLTSILDTTNKNLLLTWKNPNDSDFRGTVVVWRTDRLPTNQSDGTAIDRPSFPGSNDQYQFNDLKWNTTYYIMLFTYDNANNVSPGFSKVVAMAMGDTIAPKNVLGFKGKSESNTSFSLSWSSVTLNNDDTMITDLLRYKIYRSTDMFNCTTLLKVISATSTPTNALTFTDYYFGTRQLYYYKITAADQYDNESIDSWLIDNSESVNIITFSNDKKVWLILLSFIAQSEKGLYKNNEYKEDLDLVITQDEIDGYVIGIIKSSGEDVENYKFPSPGPQIVFTYNSSISAAEAAKFVIERSNNVEWISIGGVVDTTNLTVSAYYIYPGTYRLTKQDKVYDKFEIVKIIPRIFTPAYNDPSEMFNRVRFYCANPNGIKPTGKIFNLSGAVIQDKLEDKDRVESDNSKMYILFWDGKDKSGKVVDAGIYIYQIEAEGKVYNGTVVIAK